MAADSRPTFAARERAMKSTSTPWVGALRAILLASSLSIAAAQAWAQGLTGDGFSLTDGPDSPYYRGEIAPPSWQGRPYAIRSDDDPAF
jgi:hypothetical protein